MKKLTLILAAFAAVALVSCDDDKNDDGPIVVPGNQKNQAVWADANTASVNFTATADWTATVVEKTRATSISWLTIENPSGEAGAVTLILRLDTNTTGKDRSATITIYSDGTQVTVTIEQKSTKEDGSELDPGTDPGPDPSPKPEVSAYVESLTRNFYIEGGEFLDESTIVTNFEYDDQMRVVRITGQDTGRNHWINNTYTYSENGIKTRLVEGYSNNVEGRGEKITEGDYALDEGKIVGGDIYYWEHYIDEEKTSVKVPRLLKAYYEGDKLTEHYSYNELDNSEHRYKTSWNNDNMVKLDFNNTYTSTAEYSEELNPNINIDLNWLLLNVTVSSFSEMDGHMAILGYYGARSKNTLVKARIGWDLTFEIETADEGRIVTKASVFVPGGHLWQEYIFKYRDSDNK